MNKLLCYSGAILFSFYDSLIKNAHFFSWVNCEFESFASLEYFKSRYFVPSEWKLEYGSLIALKSSPKFSLACIFNSSPSAWELFPSWVLYNALILNWKLSRNMGDRKRIFCSCVCSGQKHLKKGSCIFEKPWGFSGVRSL